MNHILREIAKRLLDDDSKKFMETAATLYTAELEAAYIRGYIEGAINPRPLTDPQIIQLVQALRREK